MIGYLIALAIFWFIFIPKILFYISDEVSLFGLYHKIVNQNDREDVINEPLIDKILKIWIRHINLSIPFIIVYFYVIAAAFHPNEQNIDIAVYLAFLFALITLISIRFLANPSEKHFLPILVYHVTENDERLAARYENKIIDVYKERMISFFFSFVSATLIVLIVVFSYDILSGFYLLKEWETSLSQLSLIYFMEIFVSYILILLTASAISEVILSYFNPIRQFPIERNANNPNEGNQDDAGEGNNQEDIDMSYT